MKVINIVKRNELSKGSEVHESDKPVSNEYNGFQQKNIEFEIFFGSSKYIGFLNRMLRAGNNIDYVNALTPFDYCLFNDSVLPYGDLANRKSIRSDIIRQTNRIENARNLEKDTIYRYLGYIYYDYDSFTSDSITSKVLNDASRRMSGIENYMLGEISTLAGFVIGDEKGAVKLYILVVSHSRTIREMKQYEW